MNPIRSILEFSNSLTKTAFLNPFLFPTNVFIKSLTEVYIVFSSGAFSNILLNSQLEDDNNIIANRKGDDFSKMDKKLAVDMMRKEMIEASENLEFEKAAKLRDEIKKLEKELEGIF